MSHTNQQHIANLLQFELIAFRFYCVGDRNLAFPWFLDFWTLGNPYSWIWIYWNTYKKSGNMVTFKPYYFYISQHFGNPKFWFFERTGMSWDMQFYQRFAHSTSNRFARQILPRSIAPCMQVLEMSHDYCFALLILRAGVTSSYISSETHCRNCVALHF